MTTYTILGLADGYKRVYDYEEAQSITKEAEANGRKVAIVQSKKGSDWTVYKSPTCTPEY